MAGVVRHRDLGPRISEMRSGRRRRKQVAYQPYYRPRPVQNQRQKETKIMATKQTAAKTGTSIAETAKTQSLAASNMSEEDAAAIALLGDDADVDEDGLSEIDASDIKLPTKSINMKGTDRFGEEVPKTGYYDTVDETFKKTVRLVFVSMTKSNVYSVYDDSKGRNQIVCRSSDQVTGRYVESGQERPCKDCPDAKWERKANKDGKMVNTRNCSEVQNVVAWDQDEQKLFTIRFKKSAAKPWSVYLNKHHLNRGRAMKLKDSKGNPRNNVPLYMFEVMATAQIVEGKAHAIPILERGRILTKEEYAFMKEGAAFLAENKEQIARSADEQGEALDTEHEGGNGNGGDQYGGGEGQDFQDAEAAEKTMEVAPGVHI